MITVFVYGTLLVGESNHHVVSPYLLIVQPGAIYGRLYDVGLTLRLVLTDEDHKVVGEWFEVTEEGLSSHGCSGRRTTVLVISNEYERMWVSDVSG